MSLPTIAHADVQYNQWGRVEITMYEGWVFYDASDYEGWTDIDGNPVEPMPEEISYYRYGVFSPNSDLVNRIVVVAESEVPADQIFGVEQPESEKK